MTNANGNDEQVPSTLARRLEQLRDEAWMTPVLESALAAMCPSAPRVAGYDIEYCKIKPNRDINLAFHVRLRGQAGEARGARRFSSTVYPTVEACRLRYGEDERLSLPPSTLERLEAEGFSRPVTMLDEPAMIVRAFPFDPLLPGLAPATDVAQMTPVFADALQGRAPRGFDYEVLHYKPRRSCTLHYRVDAGADERRRFYGKVARDDRGASNHEVLVAAWDASLASGGAWRAARPVGYLPRWRLLLQEAVSGRDFRKVFLQLTPDDITPEQMDEARRRLAAIARAIRSVQTTAVARGPHKSFERLFGEQEKNLTYMKGLQPRLAAEIAAVREELSRLEPETAPCPEVFCHGDFAHGNVLIDGEEVGIIDFDKAGRAEQAFDVAYFLTHMWSFGIRHPKRMKHVATLSRDMRKSYLELAPDVSSERLALYEALDFAAYVLRNFRKQSHQEQWLAWAGAQVEAAWDRLGLAAGSKGSLPR